MRKVVVSFILGLLLGIIICSIYIISSSSWDVIDYSKKYGVAELVYYMLQAIGVLGTFIAIVVAIFGAEIKNMFFSPKCKVYIVDEGFTEELSAESTNVNPVVRYFKCTLVLENAGSKELLDLQLVIKDVYYSGENKKPKKISKSSEMTIFWGKPEIKKINLRETETKELIISRIVPEASEGTPDNAKKSPLRFSLTGVSLESKYNQKGKWVVNYSLQTPHKIIKTFQIEYFWTGVWCSRLTEMSSEVSAKIKEKKS